MRFRVLDTADMSRRTRCLFVDYASIQVRYILANSLREALRYFGIRDIGLFYVGILVYLGFQFRDMGYLRIFDTKNNFGS